MARALVEELNAGTVSSGAEVVVGPAYIPPWPWFAPLAHDARCLKVIDGEQAAHNLAAASTDLSKQKNRRPAAPFRNNLHEL